MMIIPTLTLNDSFVGKKIQKKKSQVAPMLTAGLSENKALDLAPASPIKGNAVPRTSLDRLEVLICSKC